MEQLSQVQARIEALKAAYHLYSGTYRQTKAPIKVAEMEDAILQSAERFERWILSGKRP